MNSNRDMYFKIDTSLYVIKPTFCKYFAILIILSVLITGWYYWLIANCMKSSKMPHMKLIFNFKSSNDKIFFFSQMFSFLIHVKLLFVKVVLCFFNCKKIKKLHLFLSRSPLRFKHCSIIVVALIAIFSDREKTRLHIINSMKFSEIY